MKKILYVLLYSLIAFAHQATGQCPSTVPTFSVDAPQNPGQKAYFLQDAIKNSAGELVAVGLVQDLNTEVNQIYFAKMDNNGNFIGLPKILSIGPGPEINFTTLEERTLFITEAFSAAGTPNGYMVAVNMTGSNDPLRDGILVIRLNQQGCVVWNQILNDDDGGALTCYGILRDGTDDYVVLAQKEFQLPPMDIVTEIFTITGNGVNVTNYRIETVKPGRMIRLASGAFGNAKWAIAGNGIVEGNVAIALLDANFNEINMVVDIYKPDIDKNAAPAVDLVAVGSDIYLIGAFKDDLNEAFVDAWLMKLSGDPTSYTSQFAPNFIYQWTRRLDFPDDPAAVTQYDFPVDIEAKNDTIVVAGCSFFESAQFTYKPWVLTFDHNGGLIKSKIFVTPQAPNGFINKVINDPNIGYYLAGVQFNTVGGGTNNIRAWFGKCDKNLVIGDCQCGADQPFNISSPVGLYIDVEDYSLNPAVFVKAPLQISCTDDVDNKQVCFQPSANNCSVDITMALDPCTGQATFVAQPINMPGTVNYTWVLQGQPQQQGQFLPAFFSSSGPVNVEVTATNGTCVAIASLVFFIQLDQQLPVFVVCPASQTVTGSLDANGNCTAIINGIDAVAEDNCPPAPITYTSVGTTTVSGNGNASGQTFNGGSSVVIYTAIDNSGNLATCTLTITVDCPVELDLFTKLYGDTAYNVPTKIKSFGDYVYLAGQTNENGELLATFSKFDPATGDLVWDFHLDMPSTILDFEYIPASVLGTDGFLLVGRTEPFSTGDNNSFIIRVLDLGVSATLDATFNQRYNLTGREAFTRIIRHPYPVNPLYPYYVLGGKNPPNNPAPPSGTDVVFLMNINHNGVQNYYAEYNYTSSPDDELGRTLFPLSFGGKRGNIVIGGNDSPANDGILVEINGGNGTVAGTARYTSPTPPFADIDIYDGLELPNGDLIIVGEYFSNNQAFISRLYSNFGTQDTRTLPDIDRFFEIGVDDQNRLYAVGRVKTGTAATTLGRQVVHRFLTDVTNPPSITLEQSWYIDDPNEDLWQNSRISVTPKHDRIFYADARRNTAPALGLKGLDIMVGAFDLDFNSACRKTFNRPQQILSISGYSAQTNFQSLPDIVPFANIFGESLPFICQDFCRICTADFSFSQTPSGCNNISFAGSGTGVPGFTYSWDFDCNGIEDATGANPTHLFPNANFPVTYQVCLRITDATGCTASISHPVLVQPDMVSPILDCPQNITLNTDVGQCCAMKNMSATATDNCSPATIAYMLSGGTVGTNPITCYKLGLTTIKATATDMAGNSKQCTYTVFVQDKETPKLNCPGNQSATVPRCDNGAVFSFSLPTVTDNCALPAMTVVSCNHLSGEKFPCGTTVITCTAMDAHQNIGSCQFSVNVTCQCASLVTSDIECTANPKVYNFSATIMNQTGSSGDCLLQLSETHANATLSGQNTVWVGNMAKVTGQITVTDPVPNPLQLLATMTCQCPFGPVSCDVQIDLIPPCCETVTLSSRELCARADTALIYLENCDNLYDVLQVKWYLGTAPCPSTASRLIQVTTGCDPLLILPGYLTKDMCVYAEVYLGNNPCKILSSNVATLNWCEKPVCEAPSFEHCYVGDPITNQPIMATVTADCNYRTEWYDQAGNLLQQNGLLYQPPALDFTASATDCYQDYVYSLWTITGCDTSVCTSNIRLWNSNAPFGTVTLNGPDVLPLCPGEDIELSFLKGCVEPSKTWRWLNGPTKFDMAPISGAGASNQRYNSNRLFVDSWFGVESKNGICPADTAKIFIPVRPAFQLHSFSAVHDPLCAPTGVLMTVDFDAQAGCNDTIRWYHDGNLVHISTTTTSPATFTYTGSPLAGVFYCVITNDCCYEKTKSPVVQLMPPCVLSILGKCYRCNNELVDLQGELQYLPAGVSVTAYSWTTSSGLIVSGGNSNTVTVGAAGTYVLSLTLSNGCVKTASFVLAQCGTVPVINLPGLSNWSVEVSPNPTTGNVLLEWTEVLPNESRIIILDALGRVIRPLNIPDGNTRLETSIGDLPEGMYFFRFEVAGKQFGVVKVIRQ